MPIPLVDTEEDMFFRELGLLHYDDQGYDVGAAFGQGQQSDGYQGMIPSCHLPQREQLHIPDFSIFPSSDGGNGLPPLPEIKLQPLSPPENWDEIVAQYLEPEVFDSEVPYLSGPYHDNIVEPEHQRFKAPHPEPQPVSLPMVRRTISEIEKAPKKHRPQDTDMGFDDHQIRLRRLIESRSLQYCGHITSPDDARKQRAVYESLSRQVGHNVIPPDLDVTFPGTDEEYRNRIQQMFEAICDWSSRREWRAKMGQKRVKKWLEDVVKRRRELGLEADLSKVCDDEIVPPPERMPGIGEQWTNVVHRSMSGIEIELLCAQILVGPLVS